MENAIRNQIPFIPDLNLKKPVVFDDVNLLKYLLFKTDKIRVPWYIFKSYKSLTNFRNLEDLTELAPNCEVPHLVPILLNGDVYVTDSILQKDIRTGKLGVNIAKEITKFSIESLYSRHNKYGWVDRLENQLKSSGRISVPDLSDAINNIHPYRDLSEQMMSSLNNFPDDIHKMSLYKLKRKMMRLRDFMKNNQIQNNHQWRCFSFFVKDDCIYNAYFIIFNIKDRRYLVNYDYILMLTDLAIMRYNIMEFCMVKNRLNSIEIPDEGIIVNVLRWFDDILLKEGNQGYDIIKLFEGICIGSYQKSFETLNICKTLLDNLLRTATDKEKHYIEVLENILKSLKHPNHIFEIFGLYRIGGHPIVDEERGMSKLKNLTREIIPVNEEGIKECFGYFLYDFIINYIRENKIWPPINLKETKNALRENNLYNSDFVEFIKNKRKIFVDYARTFPMKYWSCIKFEKIFEYNDYEDFTELLSDTAISSELYEYLSVYAPEISGIRVDRKSERRTLVALLKDEDFNLRKIREVFESGKIPLAWRVIALHSKERELKLHPRLFAMFVLQMRMLLASMEKNLAEGIFKYNKIQTMTLSEAELTNRLLEMTDPKKSAKSVPALISMDMEKFNQRWRYTAMRSTLEFLDDVYGVSCYGKIMDIYPQFFFYLASRLHPPEFLETHYSRDGINDLVINDPETVKLREQIRDEIIVNKKLSHLNTNTTWVGQLGGTEGTMQKLWTLIIGQPILYTQHITGIQSMQIGQGDNQNVLALFPKINKDLTYEDNMSNYNDNYSDQINTYIDVLSNNISYYGMVLKKEETYINSKLLNYGKEILFEGSFLTSSLKRISRMFPDVNDTFPTYDVRIAGVYSSAHSTSLKGFEPVVPYYFAIKETLEIISSEIASNQKLRLNANSHSYVAGDNIGDMNDDIYYWFVLLGKDFGGLPIMPFNDLLFRGHPDGLTSYLSWIDGLSHNIKQAKQVKDFILSKTYLKRADNLMNVIMDPTSINWNNDMGFRNKCKDILENQLNNVTRNKDIRILMRHNSKEKVKEIEEFLTSIEPFFPRAVNEIFRQTPVGHMLHFISIFKDMKTLKATLEPEQANMILKDLIDQDINRFLSIVRSYINQKRRNISSQGANKEKIWKCSTTLADEFREESYGKKIIGSTMPHPSEQFTLFPVVDNRCLRCSYEGLNNAYIYFQVTKDMSKDDFLFKRGPCQVYNGSSTKEKRAKSLVNFPRKDKSLFGCQRIARICDWIAEPGSQLVNFLENLIESRTDVPLDIIKLSAGKNFGGSAIHRFQDVILSHSSRPNIRSNSFSHIYMSTDKMGKFSQGKDNFLMMFQSAMLFGYTLITILNYYSPEVKRETFHLHVDCYECCQEVDEIKLRATRDPPQLDSYKDSKLLYTTVSSIEDRITSDSKDVFKTVDPSSWKDKSINSKIGAVCAGIIIQELISLNLDPLHIQSHGVKRTIPKLPITIDDLIKIDVISIIKYAGIYWFIDNLEALRDHSDNFHIDIFETASLLLRKIPRENYRYLIELLLVPEIMSSIMRLFQPKSPNFNIDGRGMVDIIADIMMMGIQNIHEREFSVPIVFLNRNINVLRNVHIFSMYEILSQVDEYNPEFLEALLAQMRAMRIDSLVDNKMNFGKWVVLIQNYIMNSNIKLPFIDETSYPICRIIISKTGPEPWVQMSKQLADPKIISTVSIRRKLKYRSLLKSGFEDIRSIELFSITRTGLPSPEGVDDEGHNFVVSANKNREEHIYRLTGIYSTAHYKYFEILHTFNFLWDRNFDIIFNLCEGMGGVAEFCHLFYENSVCYYNSLIDISKMVSHRGVDYVPACLYKHVINKTLEIRGLDVCLNNGGDITNPNVLEYYKSEAKRCVNPILITCDAETSGTFSSDIAIGIAQAISQILLGSPKGSVCIFKCFYNNESRLKRQLNIFYQNTNNIHCHVSNYSSKSNTECFLIFENNASNYYVENDQSISSNINIRNCHAIKNDQSHEVLGKGLLRHTKAMMSLGLESNYQYSISKLLGRSVSNRDINENLYDDMIKSKTAHESYIKSRLMAISKHEKMDKIEKLMKSSIPSDHTDIERSMYHILNFYIIKDVMLNKDWKNRFSQSLQIHINEQSVYSLDIDFEVWSNKYLRPLRHVEGHWKCYEQKSKR